MNTDDAKSLARLLSIFVAIAGCFAISDRALADLASPLDEPVTSNSDRASRPAVARHVFPESGPGFRAFGAKGDGATDDTAAMQAALNWCDGKRLTIGPGNFRHTGLTLNTDCEVVGSGRNSTFIVNTSTTSDDITVNNNIKVTFSNMYVLESSGGHKVSGYAFHFVKNYHPTLKDIDISGYNGIWDDGSGDMFLDGVNFGYLDGTTGIKCKGFDSTFQVFGAHLHQVTGSGLKFDNSNNTNLVWQDVDSYCNSIVGVNLGFALGETCLLSHDSVAAESNGSVPRFNTWPHLECDHQNGTSVEIDAGFSTVIGPSSWIGSSITGYGIILGAGDCTGPVQDTLISGARINAAAAGNIQLLGGCDTRIVNNQIASASSLSPNGFDEIVVAAGVSRYLIAGNTIIASEQNVASTDRYCIEVVGTAGSDINISNNKVGGCSSGTISFPWASSGSNIFIEANAGYNQGTWTPTLLGTETPGTYTYSIQNGSYYLSNAAIRVIGRIDTSARSVAPTGNLLLSGLPFNSSAAANGDASCTIGEFGGYTLTAGFTALGASVPPGVAAVSLFESGSNQAVTFYPADLLGTSSSIEFSCTYPLKP